ncbi:S8 family serine peptidase [Halobacillus sp. BBL2006]|uniref:S8 family serine peptidase n=1 Tax=Halobacillus sp. BBL2006 TaxID=1543706 RepID=UPI00068B5FAF|nr:S8 family serine peptidase [Halobacillus sp. BBL2006]
MKKVGIELLVVLMVVSLLVPSNVLAAEGEWSNSMQSVHVQKESGKRAFSSRSVENQLKETYMKNESRNLKTYSKEDLKRSLNYRKPKDYQSSSLSDVNLSDVHDRRILLKTNGQDKILFKDLKVEKIATPKALAERDYQIVKVPEDVDYNKKLQEIRNHKAVKMADPEYIKETSYIPSDSSYDEQWYLDKLDMEQAWDNQRGSGDVTVAVLDSGVNAKHPDLQGRVLQGFDFSNGDGDPSDDNGHGTHVAGLIAANEDQSGIVGVDHKTNILPVKVMNRDGEASLSSILNGVYYAMDQGADVINMSYGSYQASDAEIDALWDAYNEGIVLVAAAGNESTNDRLYPSAYLPVISVAATDRYDNKADFSNFGASIDVTAPGQDLYSTSYYGGYQTGSGTSFSAPLVSGVAALLKAEYPDWSPQQVEYALESSTKKLSSGVWNPLDGYGLVNANLALKAASPSLSGDAGNWFDEAEPLKSTQNQAFEMPGDEDWYSFRLDSPTTVNLELKNVSTPIDIVGLLYKDDGDTFSQQLVMDNNSMGESETSTTDLAAGTYYFRVVDYDSHWSSEAYSLTFTKAYDESDDPGVTDEIEPNDTIGYADFLSFGSIGRGYFQTYQDYDVFEVELPEPGRLAITTATSKYAADNEPLALLLDYNGEVMEVADVVGLADEDLKYNVETFNQVSSGTHYVVLANYYEYADPNPYVFSVDYVDEPLQVDPPESNYASGEYEQSIRVQLSAPQEEASIKYTLDGTTPDLNHGKEYTDSILVEQDTTIKAVSIIDGVKSDVSTFFYMISETPKSFPDVVGQWAEEEINYLVSKNLINGYPNGNFGFHDKITRAEAATIIVREMNLPLESSNFEDVSSYHWADKYIGAAAKNGFITGYSKDTFKPDASLSREEMAAILVRAYQLSGTGNVSFPDMKTDHWSYPFVEKLVANQITNGYPDGTFKPQNNIQRSEFAVMVARVLNEDYRP